MKTLLSRIVLASAFAVIPQGYQQTVVNSTHFDVAIHIEYMSNLCRSDMFNLEAGGTVTRKSGACIVKAVRATVYQKGDGKTASAKVEATPFVGTLAGKGNWEVTGPVGGKYSIVKKQP